MKLNFRSNLSSTLKLISNWSSVIQVSSLVVFTILASLPIGFAHNFQGQMNLDLLLNITFFWLGAALGHLIFVYESFLNTLVDKVGSWLAHQQSSETQLNPAQPVSSQTSSQFSWLRNHLIFLLLPVVSVYLLTSSRSNLGLGFLFGLASVYFADIIDYLRFGGQALFPTRSFLNRPSLQQLQTISFGYLLYYAALITALVLL